MKLIADGAAFKAECHRLIDAIPKHEARTALQAALADLVINTGISLTADTFAHQVSMIAFIDRGRAHRLVDAVSDRSLTWAGAIAVAAFRFSAKIGALALFVWLVARCAS